MGIKKKRMSEGRKTQIVLLDERRLDILIQPKLYTGELLDLVSSHFNLKEKEYFGLAFKDETGHFHWLQLDRKVLEHDFPKKGGQLALYFAVRFYIESITYLKDSSTVELFYQQAKRSIFRDEVECDSNTIFELAAHVLQASYGDYINEDVAKERLKKLPVLPTSALKDHPSISYCEQEVINSYKKLSGQNRGSAIVNYMSIVEGLPTYGIHYYEVKDKGGIPWWLGLSYKGIAQYDFNDKKVPRKVFSWKQLENLYFRDKKFSIEVHDPKRIVHTLSSFNLYEDAIQEHIEDFDDLSDAISDPTTQVSVSRRTFGPSKVNVHAWFAATPALTKCIWSMAVSQHQFYLDRKQSKTQLPSVRSMHEIAADLCRSTSSLPSSTSGSLSRSNSNHSLTMSLSTNDTKTDIASEENDSTREVNDIYVALKVRKEALEIALRRKTEELKQLCLKEAEVTGELPPEFPLIAGEIIPQVQKRTSNSTLSSKVNTEDNSSDVDVLEPAMSRLYTSSSTGSDPQISESSASLSHHPLHGFSRSSTPSPSSPRPVKVGYTPNALYQTRTQYRSQNYPTFTTRGYASSSPHSDYDNVNSPAQPQGRNASLISPSSHQNSPGEAIHNFYNVNTHQLGHDGSAHDFGKSSSSDDLQDLRDAHMKNPVWLPSKHGSLEGAYSRRNIGNDQRYLNGSNNQRGYYQEHPDQQQHLPSPTHRPHPERGGQGFIIPNLTPSRFGSKRESTVDYAESMYPTEDYTVYNAGSSQIRSTSSREDYDVPQPSHHYKQNTWDRTGEGHHGMGGEMGGQNYGLRGAQDQSMMDSDLGSPYSDYQHQSVSHYDSFGSLKQQQPPRSNSNTEISLPQTCIQDPTYDNNRMSPNVNSPQQVMTVTKYQNYVEVSKAFEMSDFYKYSEKLRKQRTINCRQQKLEAVLSGQPLPKSQYAGPPPVPVRYSSYPSEFSGGDNSPGPLSPVGSLYGSPARPSSPYTSSPQAAGQWPTQSPMPHPGQQSSLVQSSPVPGMYHNPQNIQGHVNEQYGAQGAYQPGQPLSPSIATQQTPYQAPKALTCEPIQSSKYASTV